MPSIDVPCCDEVQPRTLEILLLALVLGTRGADIITQNFDLINRSLMAALLVRRAVHLVRCRRKDEIGGGEKLGMCRRGEPIDSWDAHSTRLGGWFCNYKQLIARKSLQHTYRLWVKSGRYLSTYLPGGVQTISNILTEYILLHRFSMGDNVTRRCARRAAFRNCGSCAILTIQVPRY